MITRIEATNYRCFERLDVDLQSFAVLVGANGAGKTTLLDIPGLLGDCLEQQNIGQAFITRQNNKPPRCSTLNELVFGGQGSHFILSVEAQLPENVIQVLLPIQSGPVQNDPERWLRYIRYEVRFEIFNQRELVVGSEHLFLFSRKNAPSRNGIRIHGDFSGQTGWRTILKRESGTDAVFRAETQKNAKSKPMHIQASMLALPKLKFESADDFPAASWFHDLLSQRSVFYQPDLSLLQSACAPGLPKEIMGNGANLPWLALDLQQDENRFSMWVEHVQTALPQVSGIRVKEREEDHHAYFIITYNGGYEITSSGLSEGTLRILALTILPYLVNLPFLIITEEPENGIHPRAIETVLQSLSSVYDSQVLVSSHSPVVLAQSKLDQILCARLAENGSATIVPGINHPQLKDWQGQIDLGALFAAGVLG